MAIKVTLLQEPCFLWTKGAKFRTEVVNLYNYVTFSIDLLASIQRIILILRKSPGDIPPFLLVIAGYQRYPGYQKNSVYQNNLAYQGS